MDRQPNRRAFRPSVDRLETLRLLSGGVHTLATVDLRNTPIAADLTRAIGNNSPHSRRQSIVVNQISGDNANDSVMGVAQINYKIPMLGTVTTKVQFRTSVASPKTNDVSVTLSKFNSFLRSSDRVRLQRAVVQFVRTDHDALLAKLHPTV